MTHIWNGKRMGCLCKELAGEAMELSPVCIGNLWMFENLALPDLEALSTRASRRKYEAGEAVFHQGDPAGQIFLIKAGRVKLSKVTEDGDEITLDIRKAGDSLGENMLNEEGEFPLTAVCLEPSLTCGFDKQVFEALVLDHPNIGLQVIRNLSARIDWLTSRVGSMSHTNLEERLYRVLVNVAREHGRREGGGFRLDMPLTHEDLSFLAGAHRVSITRAMKGLRESGRVIREGRSLMLPMAG